MKTYNEMKKAALTNLAVYETLKAFAYLNSPRYDFEILKGKQAIADRAVNNL